MLRPNTVSVVESVGEIRGIGGTCRFPITQQCDHDHSIVLQYPGGEVEGLIDSPAKACRDQRSLLCGRIELAKCDADAGESGTVLEVEVFQFKVLDSGSIGRCRHDEMLETQFTLA